jgi:hypothetical protein
MDDLELEQLVLREYGRGDDKDWSGCRRAPIEVLPQGGPVARPQAWDSSTVE